MNILKYIPFLVFVALIFPMVVLNGQEPGEKVGLSALLEGTESIGGKPAYLGSPFVTAGDRVYMVGHQNGSFPELGWHIQGEMGGIWDHPVKLMDGFDAELIFDDRTLELNRADSFVNYPMANAHLYDLKEVGLQIERFQFAPDHREGLVVEYSIRNEGSAPIEFIFSFTGHSDLRPTWLGEKTGMRDGVDRASYLEENGAWMVRDSLSPWFLVYGAGSIPGSWSERENPYSGQGSSNGLDYKLRLEPGENRSLVFIIAGSLVSEERALQEYDGISAGYRDLLQQKRDRYKELERRSRLTIPDKEMQQAFEWLKYNCDWLLRSVPGTGSGIMAGIPDYPWWFGVDSEYALQGYMAIGQHEAAYSTIRLLDSISEKVNGNGRIVHEVSTNGYVFNPGNINETPQFASLIREVYRWNGDTGFLEKYFPTVQKGLTWLMEENDSDGNLFPEGFGMMEIHGMDSEMIDVASYTQKAFRDASEMAEALGKEELAKEYAELASRLQGKINREFWSEEFGSYADFIGSDEQALELIEDAIVRADTLEKPWAVRELEETRKIIKENPSGVPRPFVLHHNWVVNTPMEMGVADPEKAAIALRTAERFVNPFGVFVTGIDRDDSAGSDEGSFKGSKVFSYTGAVMTLPTGVQAVGENNYGRHDRALNYLERMTRTFSYALPGSMYEVSPDYGMMTQAWNIYSFAVPIVRQFFGIRPQASERTVLIEPGMPEQWEEASLENVRVGDNEVSVYYRKSETELLIRAEQTVPGWTLILSPGMGKPGEIEVLEGEVSGDPEHPVVTSTGTVAEFKVRFQWASERK